VERAKALIRDEEIKRLILYAKCLGIKVTIYQRKSKDGNEAAWTMDGKSIDLWVSPTTSKTDIVLSLIHELGHHLVWVHDKNRQHPKNLDKAIDKTTNGENLTANQRYLLYLDEVDGTAYWDVIIKEVNIKIPKWRVEAQKKIDLWMYDWFWRKGVWPNGKTQIHTRRKIFEDYKFRLG
jgi:hypothetical protein